MTGNRLKRGSSIVAGVAIAGGLGAVLSTTALAGPAAKAPAGYVTAVVAGTPDSAGKVPTFNGVPGSAVTNLDVAVPLAELTPGQSYEVLVASQNGPAAGQTCVSSYAIVQKVGGNKTTIVGGNIATFSCAANAVYAYAAKTAAIPADPGPATLIGTVKFGTKTVSLDIPISIS